MPRKLSGTNPKLNRIKNALKVAGASQRLVCLWLDVDYTSISSWNSNKVQPNNDNLNKLGELLEIDNRELFESQGRFKTGLAKALELELVRINKEESIPFEIEKFDSVKKKNIWVNNPELIKRLKKYAVTYKKTHGKISPIYLNKIFSEISKDELKGKEVIICNSNDSTSKKMEYQVVHLKIEDQFIAKFNDITSAENYVDLIHRGFVKFK